MNEPTFDKNEILKVGQQVIYQEGGDYTIAVVLNANVNPDETFAVYRMRAVEPLKGDFFKPGQEWECSLRAGYRGYVGWYTYPDTPENRSKICG